MASITWTGVFALLIAELVITFILVVPFPRRIRNFIARSFIFRFRLGGETVSKALLFLAFALMLALVESYFSVQRLMEKLTALEEQDIVAGSVAHGHGHYHDKQKLYRAERNMYLAGFALTLLFVIGRLLQLMQESVQLEDELEFVRKPLHATPHAAAKGDATTTVGTEGVEMTETKKKPNEKKKD
jgi:B-cell receptor-associated protein 31